MVEGQGDTWNMTVLEKATPRSLHLLLAFNDLLNFMEKTSWPEVKITLYELFGIKDHSYQGRERNFQGP